MQKLHRKSGQGMTEYIIIIAIIAIGAILIVGLFGKQIKTTFTGMGKSLAGENDGAADASATAGEMDTEQGVRETMGTFDEDQ
jgi:Flp pilus assembly pilin Flp